MNRAVILQHLEVEGPGRVADILQQQGFSLSVHTLRSATDVPQGVAPDDVLVVMGGSMGVADIGSAEFPYLAPEVELIKQRIAEDSPTLGICLGAQLIAHAAGALVYPMKTHEGTRLYEVGWGSLRFHRLPQDPLLQGIPDEAQVVHWHGDQFELPAGARLFASTAACSQGFQLGRRVFGLQFHCELDTPQIEDFLREDEAYVLQANGPQGVERIRRDTAQHMASFQAVGGRLLGNMLRAMLEA